MTISSYEEADRHLERAWFAALVAATFDGIVGAMAILGSREFTLAATLYMSRVALMLLLAYGVARRNRFAAIGLLVLGVLTLDLSVGLVGFARSVLGVVFVYLYARGVQAAYAYRRLLAAGPDAPVRSRETRFQSSGRVHPEL